MAASIMVIDNDQTVLALLDEILTMTGHETHLYTYGLPDQEEILRVRPDLIICDYLMDGDQVGQELWGCFRGNLCWRTRGSCSVPRLSGIWLSAPVGGVRREFRSLPSRLTLTTFCARFTTPLLRPAV